MKQLSADNKIIKTSRCSYSCLVKESYHYDLSETAKNISLSIQKRFPLVNYQIWELYQINEFVNHQMAHNTIFVDVENELEESIFNFLFEDYQHVLFKPTFNEYYKYSKDETIVVKKLISESPSFVNEYHQASLEKILVDLFGKGISGSIISQSEYKAIYEDCFKKYQINTSALFRYARRRGNNKTIMKFIEENTNIFKD